MVEFIKEAFAEIFPHKVDQYSFTVKYSRRFSGYNANVRYSRDKMDFHLSSEWEEISEEIKKGLIQSLLLRALKAKHAAKKKTIYLDLYNSFLKNLHLAIPKNDVDPILKESFDRVNEKYEDGLITMPNLVRGRRAKRVLGTYEYSTDRIVISNELKNAPQELLDYVMYHELLHKKHKFKASAMRSHHHTAAFRADESRFQNFPIMEKKLNAFLRRRSISDFFFG